MPSLLSPAHSPGLAAGSSLTSRRCRAARHRPGGRSPPAGICRPVITAVNPAAIPARPLPGCWVVPPAASSARLAGGDPSYPTTKYMSPVGGVLKRCASGAACFPPPFPSRRPGTRTPDLTVRRFPELLTSTDYSPRAVVRTGGTGYTFDAAAPDPCPGGASVGEVDRQPARWPAGTGWWCSPGLAHCAGKSGAMPAVRLRRAEAARRCRGRFLAHVSRL